ncbi:MAG: HAD-IA family hydrolase [Chitinivibrionales bacterium]|nr:HAD-IA family hydrolase [Chitinivibrionales bacterium]
MPVVASFMLEPVSGIIFDFDGTLYHMRWYMRPLITLKLFPHILRLPRYMKVRTILADKDLGSGESLMSELCRMLAEEEGISAQAIHAWIYNSFYPAFIGTLSSLRNTRPGLNNLLVELKGRNIRLAVLSDFDKVRERCEKLKIDISVFDPIVSSEAQGALKPAVRPFAEIQKAWGVPSSEILVIGDRFDTDGDAAQRLGMQFIQIAGNRKYRGRKTMSWKRIKRMLMQIYSRKEHKI